MTIDAKAKLMAALDNAEEYRVLAIRSRDRGAREVFGVELYVKIRPGARGAGRRLTERAKLRRSRIRMEERAVTETESG
jgi:hypothetical protein